MDYDVFFSLMGNLGNMLAVISTNATFYVGLAMPPIIDIINKDVKNSKERFFVTLLVCISAGIVLRWNDLTAGNTEELLGAMGIIFIESQAVYRLYFKNSNVRSMMATKLNLIPENVEGLK